VGDLFLKPRRFHATPHYAVRIALFSGAFESSERALSWDDAEAVLTVTPTGIEHPTRERWRTYDDRSELRLRTGDPGTYVIGVSTRSDTVRLGADAFDRFLVAEGLSAFLEDRPSRGDFGRPAVVRRSTHAKTLLQVGDERTPEYGSVLGQAAELVPLANPYELRGGDTLAVRAMVDGRPVPNLVLTAGGRSVADTTMTAVRILTDADGVGRVPLRSGGEWYVKVLWVAPLEGDSVAGYESRRATLTFHVQG